jgi:hypothetical protein
MKNHQRENSGSDNGNEPWQFSLRGLLVFVTVVSVLLAIGVYYVGIIIALAVVGLIQVGPLLVADWLIRPQHRRTLAFVTAGSWAIVGSSFVIFAVCAASRLVSSSGSLNWTFASCSIVGAAFCYFLAGLRWRQLSTPRSAGEARQ